MGNFDNTTQSSDMTNYNKGTNVLFEKISFFFCFN